MHLSFHLFLPHESGVQVVGSIGPPLGAQEHRLNYIAQHLFQRPTVFLIQPHNEQGQHGQHHEDGGGACAQAAPEQKEKRNADKRAAAKADELPLGQIKEEL